MLKKKEGTELIKYYQWEEDVEQLHKGANKELNIGGKKKKKKSEKKSGNLLDESFEYDKANLTKKMVVESQKVIFDGIHCEKSFYIWSKQNSMRKLLYKFCTSNRFEGIILILIVLSSIKLVIDTYLFDLPADNPIVKISGDLDNFFTAAFALESILKSIAFGFFFDKGSYLRETWN